MPPGEAPDVEGSSAEEVSLPRDAQSQAERGGGDPLLGKSPETHEEGVGRGVQNEVESDLQGGVAGSPSGTLSSSGSPSQVDAILSAEAWIHQKSNTTPRWSPKHSDLELLNKLFERTRNPERGLRTELADRFGCTERQVRCMEGATA